MRIFHILCKVVILEEWCKVLSHQTSHARANKVVLRISSPKGWMACTWYFKSKEMDGFYNSCNRMDFTIFRLIGF